MMSSSSMRKNPLIVLMGAVFAGMATFVVFLAVTAFLTRILTHSLNGLVSWAVIDIVASITLAFISFVVTLKVLNRP
jgi:hypothetical protein